MDKIEKIRKKIKELQDEFVSIHPKDCSLKLIKSYAGYAYLDKVLSFIDTLEEESDNGMEEAVDGVIVGEIGKQEDEPHEIYVESMSLPLDGKWKMGDKVRIVILPNKEEK